MPELRKSNLPYTRVVVVVRSLLLIATAVLVLGCGGVGLKPVSEGVIPDGVVLRPGEHQQFILVERGVSITNATWSTDRGGISNKGMYTAPDTPGEGQGYGLE